MIKKLLFLSLLSVLFGAVASAASTTSGTSNGGTLGSTDISGSISVSNGGTWSNDSATASTSSISLGKLGAAVVVHYATTSNGDNTVSNYSIEDDTLSTSVSKSAPNKYGTYATGGHTYSSSQYGSWSGSTDQSF